MNISTASTASTSLDRGIDDDVKRKRRRRTQACFESNSGCNIVINNTNRSSSSSSSSSSSLKLDGYHVMVLSIAAFLFVFCCCVKETPVLVTAFVQQRGSGDTTAGRRIIITEEWNKRTTRPITIISLSAKREDKKKLPDEDSSSSTSSSFSRFFSSGQKEDGKDGMDDSKKSSSGKEGGDKQNSNGIPIVGRFFGNEKEKKRKTMKIDDPDNNDEAKSNIVNKVGNYFSERQIRKDAEDLRREVKRREEEKQQQLERDAEDLRLEVQRREEDRKQKIADYQIKLSIAKSKKKADKIKIQLEAQKAMDQKRKERLEMKKKEKEEKEKNDSDDDNNNDNEESTSGRIYSYIGAAQKYVSSVLEQKKTEEWIIVAPKTRISPGEIVPVTAGGIDLLLVASKDGGLHCVANSCPHLGTPLEVGSLERLPIESSTATMSIDSRGEDADVKIMKDTSFFKENDITRMLKQDGCEDCIVCPLHKTAFALESGEVRGEWCPYPPVIGPITGALKQQSNLPIFDVRTRGKNIEVRLNTPVEISDMSSSSDSNNKI
jgi:nitrite reductase/ring-hydroxylating ferredoxin subunit